jgi:hypothetical protein
MPGALSLMRDYRSLARHQRQRRSFSWRSGYPDEAIAPHGVAQSGIVFLRKPFADGALLRTVRAALET